MSDRSEKKKRVIPLRDDLAIYTQGMAAAFFDLKPAAFRFKEQYYKDDIQITRTPGGKRMYSLNNILAIAHALRRADKMTDRQLRLIVMRVDAFKEPVKKHRLKYRKGKPSE